MWLLDVDGVVNASRPGWGAAPRHGWAYADGLRWRIRWAPGLVREIIRLRGEFDLDIRWASTWCQESFCPGVPDVHQVEQIVGLPRLPVAFGSYTSARAAKVRAAADVLTTGHPLIWTDDDAIPQSDDEDWAPVFSATADRRLFLSPNPGRGLQPHDLHAVRTFLTGPAGEVTDG